MTKGSITKLSELLVNLDAVHRLLIALGLGIIFYFIFGWLQVRLVTRLMMSWDVFSLMMVLMIWAIFFGIPESRINLLAQREDDSRTVTFFLVVLSVLVSLFGIAILLKGTGERYINRGVHEPVSMVSVGLSWILLHTIFTIHYAHLFYDDGGQIKGTSSAGIEFPGKNNPDYIDFAYFSFVIGMTFQVSDTTVSSRQIRRLVLLHSVLSFLFNTIIVALTISIISSK